MELRDFYFEVPEDLIAQEPVSPRDSSRLLVLDRRTGAMEHTRTLELPQHMQPGDALVFNDSRVIPARMRGQRLPTGGKVEVLLLRPRTEKVWEALVHPRARGPAGQVLSLGGGQVKARVLERTETGCLLELEGPGEVQEMLRRWGEVPLPPYIRRPWQPQDREDYQTVYARSPGSVAAPTAGLHFTHRLLERLADRGVELHYITLHVGPGTFQPVRASRVEEHTMHSEFFQLSADTAARLAAVRSRGGRVIAVGTTVVRTLEACVDEAGELRPGEGTTSLFIYPGYRFRMVDGLLTNFHLPRSTLLMLAAAMAGKDRLLAAYREAVARRYRFYSYGDAMLIV